MDSRYWCVCCDGSWKIPAVLTRLIFLCAAGMTTAGIMCTPEGKEYRFTLDSFSGKVADGWRIFGPRLCGKRMMMGMRRFVRGLPTIFRLEPPMMCAAHMEVAC